MEVFVLIDSSENLICNQVIGVLDHADITDIEIAAYFGAFTRVSCQDIRDSGIEWVMDIETEDGEIHQIRLECYRVNEI
jgi:hypothetical protein